MHKGLWTFLLLALVAAILAPPAGAVTTFPAGEYRGGIDDRSNLFTEPDGGDGFLEPGGQGDPVNVGDEQRTIAKITDFNTGSKQLNLTDGTKSVVSDGGSVDYANGQLTGMVYDLEVARIINQDTGDSVTTITPPATGSTAPYRLEKGSGGRYTSSGGTAGTWTDTIGDPGELVADSAAGVNYGGIMVLYDDPARNLAFVGDGEGDPGPHDWREPGDGSGTSPHPGQAAMEIPAGTAAAIDGGTVLTNADYFPTISDVAGSNTSVADSGTAEPWLVAVFADLADIPAHDGFPANPYGVGDGTFLQETEFVLDENGAASLDGLAFANIIGGTGASQFALNNFTISGGGVDWRADLRIEFEGFNNGALFNGWQINSDDPIQFGISGAVPEPATLCLLGFALVGLAGLRRRK